MDNERRHGEDYTGRRRLVWNVITGWIAHVITIATGFVVPRLIDDNLGQTELGIWDFGWATVRYLSFSTLGAAASLNRYVALHRASGDRAALCRMVSSVVACQIVIAVVATVVILSVVAAIPSFVHEDDADQIALLQAVVALLAFGVVVQVLSSPARGVITGCHRWDLHNAVNGVTDILMMVTLIGALLFGAGLATLAAIHLGVLAVMEAYRWVQAFRVCKELRIKAAYAEWASARETLAFGLKSMTFALPRTVVIQTTNILLAGQAGTAMLALLARPLALVTHVETLIKRLAFVLAPVTGGMVGLGRREDVAELFVQAGRASIMIAAPAMALLAMYGKYILLLWMGAEYASERLPLYLSIGLFLPVSQGISLGVLSGLNVHGRIGAASLLLVVVVFAAIVAGTPAGWWSAEHAAIVMGVTLTLGPGALVPTLACRVLGVRLRDYLRRAVLPPLGCVALFVASVLLVRSRVPLHNVLAAELIGLGVGAAVLGTLYWKFLLPERVKWTLLRAVRRGR